MKRLQQPIPDDLHRHLQKYALMRHTTMRQVVLEAIAHETQYGQRQLAVKWVPQSPIATAEEIADIVGVK
jgi:predicted transcriptional regulator